MTTDVVFYPHAIHAKIPAGADLFQCTHIRDFEPAHNYQDITEFAAGQVGPAFTGSHQASPDFRFSTPQMGTLLGVTIAGVYYIARSLTLHEVDILYKAGQNLGTRVADATTSHLRLRMDRNALLVLESITARQGGTAEARFRLVATLNEQTGADPLVPVAGVALTATSAVGLIHTLGSTRINGTAIKGVEDVTLENNVEYEEHSSGGDGFPTYVGIKSYRPVLRIQTRKTDYIATYGTRGTALSSLSQYFRNKLASGINEPDGSAFHILLSATTGTVKARRIQSGNALCEITIDLANTTQNTAAYTLATNVAIS